MDRRTFVKGSALSISAAALGHADTPPNQNEWVLENGQIAWHLERHANGVRSTAFENRVTGRRHVLNTASEFTVAISGSQRIEIPWWDFASTDDGTVGPDQESGFLNHFQRLDGSQKVWRKALNLAGGHNGRVYGGYAWYRHTFSVPQSLAGRDITFVLGGYDQQDWNERWIYLNGQQIGYSQTSGRWRKPGVYKLNAAELTSGVLQFGPGSVNLLAVRTRAYDFRFGGISDQALERFVFRPILFDQYFTAGDPLVPVSNFEFQGISQESATEAAVRLRDPAYALNVTAHYQLDGYVRRKWLEIRNESKREQLILDVTVDDYTVAGQLTEGGYGEPVFLDNEAFFALEHPAGVNQAMAGAVRLWHCPGKLVQPGEVITSQVSLVGVAPQNQVRDSFHNYVAAHSPRAKKKHFSVFTCYGINNQWGACPALTDEEVLNCQSVIRGWQAKDVKFDYFTLDQGWPDNDGDLKTFAETCYPDGPRLMIDGVRALNMKFGLWFSVSGGSWSDGAYQPVQTSAIPAAGELGVPPTDAPIAAYRNGYPAAGGVGRTLCIASDPYFRVFKSAIEHHVAHNDVRLLKFDIGSYYCNSTHHEHLPGKYSTEAMFDHLIDVVKSARVLAPDVVVFWYWGVGTSPFWALHGDAIFESGLYMEGSGTSWYPSLYYRDSVTLSLDQNTRFVEFIPPLLKDSLGVWLSQIRWANFMGKERWREALVMDLGRGNLIFPQLWGDPNLLNDDDLHFLSKMIAFARDNERILLRPRRNFGDPWKNDPYGYAFCDGARGLVFCNNMHFSARKVSFHLGPEIGMLARRGEPVQLTTYFPDQAEIQLSDNTDFRVGSNVEFWMRPFETLLLQIHPRRPRTLSRRRLSQSEAEQYGASLKLSKSAMEPWMEMEFADEERFRKAGMRHEVQCFSTRLPKISEGRSILAIQIQLRRGSEEFRYSPVVAELVQLRVSIGGHSTQLIPVPDARQYGNTQNSGCSWVVYKVPLSAAHSEQALAFAVHSYLPVGVEGVTDVWLVKRWWQESTRPVADGYYGQAPS